MNKINKTEITPIELAPTSQDESSQTQNPLSKTDFLIQRIAESRVNSPVSSSTSSSPLYAAYYRSLSSSPRPFSPAPTKTDSPPAKIDSLPEPTETASSEALNSGLERVEGLEKNPPSPRALLKLLAHKRANSAREEL